MMDNSFWALIALVIFLLIMIYYGVPSYLKDSLDKRAARIAGELEEARRLREEARQVLAEYQKKRFKAEQEAQEIIASAKRQAQNMVADMRADTEAFIECRNKMIEQKIEQTGVDAMQFIRSAAIDKAVFAVKTVLEDELKTKNGAGESDRLFKQSVEDIRNSLKNA